MGTKIKYTCGDGFLMSPDNIEGIVCSDSGDWDYYESASGVTSVVTFSGRPVCIRSLKFNFVNKLKIDA